MKILAVNGSPRHRGNTRTLIDTVLQEIQKAGMETEVYQAGGRTVNGCRACGQCGKAQNRRCAINDWLTEELLPKIFEADALILGSPTYYGDLTPEIKAVMDRSGYVSMHNGRLLDRKIGAAVVAVRRTGGLHVLDSLQHFFLINGMIVPGSTYWNMSLCRELGEAQKDEEGLNTMRKLGENIAWLLNKLAG